jgi:hypothetical protein
MHIFNLNFRWLASFGKDVMLNVWPIKVCLRSEDAFVITCVASLMEVKVLYVQQDLQNEISSYWRFNV